MPTCRECLHWRPAGLAEEGPCHRHAPEPLVFLRYSDAALPPAAPVWPTTAADDSCGEWRPLPVRPDDPALVRAEHAEAEVKRLQAIIDGFAARISTQSELLTRRAEGGGPQ